MAHNPIIVISKNDSSLAVDQGYIIPFWNNPNLFQSNPSISDGEIFPFLMISLFPPLFNSHRSRGKPLDPPVLVFTSVLRCSSYNSSYISHIILIHISLRWLYHVHHPSRLQPGSPKPLIFCISAGKPLTSVEKPMLS